MAEQKEARRYITPQKAGIIIGISFLVIIIAISGIIISAITPKEPPASAKISAAAAPAVPDFPLCANGEYDFSNLDIKKVGKVEFTVSPGCWVKVTLPSKDCVTHDPSVEVKKVWDNGAVDIDGPNRVVPARTGNIIFVKSLQEEGVYKIFARK
ncbi:MAG: hypothetical protein M1170_01715 [Patescibacteria group bacterium]|nr:hypothetical protein [Patescibacteria group bacterium]